MLESLWRVVNRNARGRRRPRWTRPHALQPRNRCSSICRSRTPSPHLVRERPGGACQGAATCRGVSDGLGVAQPTSVVVESAVFARCRLAHPCDTQRDDGEPLSVLRARDRGDKQENGFVLST
jgi:hypothetical protein